MSHQNFFTTIKWKLFQENSSSALQQSINWMKFIKWDWQYYSRSRSNVQEKPRSRFTRRTLADWLSDKQETRRPKETQFSWEKKLCIKEKMDSLWTPRNITSLNGWCYEAIDLSISQNIFSYLKIFSMQCRYTNINTYIICHENDSK